MQDKNILIISNKSDITTDLVIKRLYERGISFIRFNTEEFPQNIFSEITLNNKINSSIFTTKGELTEEKIESIWYRRPKTASLKNISISKEEFEFAIRESNSFLFNLWSILNEKMWVNNPFKLYNAERKALQLKVATKCSMAIPATIITNRIESVKEFIKLYNGKVIVKPISHGGFGNNDEYAIFTTDLENNEFELTEESIKFSPFILQEKIDKAYDVRVNIFGNRIIAHKINSKNDFQGIDWRVLKPEEIFYEQIALTPSKIEKILKFVSFFDLKYSAMDFVVSKNGQWYFLENNPNGQFAWLEIANGGNLIDSLIDLLWS